MLGVPLTGYWNNLNFSWNKHTNFRENCMRMRWDKKDPWWIKSYTQMIKKKMDTFLLGLDTCQFHSKLGAIRATFDSWPAVHWWLSIQSSLDLQCRNSMAKQGLRAQLRSDWVADEPDDEAVSFRLNLWRICRMSRLLCKKITQQVSTSRAELQEKGDAILQSWICRVRSIGSG